MRWPVRWTAVLHGRPANPGATDSVPRCPPVVRQRYCSSVWAAAQRASPIHALSFTVVTIKSCGHSFLNTYICWSLFNSSKGLMTGWIALIGWRAITAGSEQKIQSCRFTHWNRIALFQEYTVFSLTWHFNSPFSNGQKTHFLLMGGQAW